MDKMVGFIVMSIEDARKISLQAGQDKYRSWFIAGTNAARYARFKEDVDSILALDGYADCIVTE